MARGCKRKRRVQDAPTPNNGAPSGLNSPVKRDVLAQYYPFVCTLREHVLSKLPDSSRLRRKKISTLGLTPDCSEIESRLAHILDTSLVCCAAQSSPSSESEEARWQQWLSFSQKGDESYVALSDGISSSVAIQSEIVDFVIWLLFSRDKGVGAWMPKNLLCYGFRRHATDHQAARNTIPGIFSSHPNFHVKALREAPWPHLLALLGQSGGRVMVDLLVDCSIFVKIESGMQNYYQLSGVPLSQLNIIVKAEDHAPRAQIRKLSDILLVRGKMFYTKPALTARGLIQPGFKSIHALNRLTYTRESVQSEDNKSDDALVKIRQRNEAHTTQLMMYIFPRQFGLHNVFTSQVDTMKTTWGFQDYTLREEEIAKAMEHNKTSSESRLPKLPKRLRGPARELVQRLQILHGRCSYTELFRHYCPSTIDNSHRSKKTNSSREPTLGTKTSHPSSTLTNASQRESQTKRRTRKLHTESQVPHSIQNKSLVDLASPPSEVSAFCQVVLSKIIPNGFWGDGDNYCHNKAVFTKKVDHIVKLRRFESISLHEIVQDFKIAELAWLQPPGCQGQKSSQTDMNKRYELFHEFLYYVFDSLLVALIKSNFYVTESNTHRFQSFYFRHDVWKLVAEPAMSTLKASMFEEIKLDEAKRILDSRRLGFSQMRLLPKGAKVRPIMNLGRRNMRDDKGVKSLGPSINSVLGPIHTALRLEKDINRSKLGSTLFAVGSIYERLKSFKNSLGSNQRALYFAKVDVKAAFDTIPQAAVVKLMSSVLSQKQYVVAKHSEVKPGELSGGKTTAKPVRRWLATAIAPGQPPALLDRLDSDTCTKNKNTVFVDAASKKIHDVHALLGLLAEHVGQNIVKIGKKYYRQTKGIPQGSVLSSFLCNYFYADLEAQHLYFLDAPDCLLMRLVDDFLLITLDKSKAIRFVEKMQSGLPEYGVEIGHDKTLVNFDMRIGDESVRKISKGSRFPYCGTAIDCHTLDIAKDRDKSKDKGIHISTSLTVQFGRSPGQNFHKKVVDSFKYQSHLMFFDTEHNSIRTVLDTLRGAFSQTALKMWAYIRCLPASRQPNANLIIRTITKVADVAFIILTSKSRKMRYAHYACNLHKAQISAVAHAAFLGVLRRKQTKYQRVIAWLQGEVARLGSVG